MKLTVTLQTADEAAFQFLMGRANANLAAKKEPPFSSLEVYTLYLLSQYIAMETQGVAAEQKAAALRKVQDAPASVTAADKAVLGIK